VEAYEPYPSLALALLVGLLIGLEREQSRPAPYTGRGFPGGIRTYPLFALLGAVGMLLLPAVGPWVVVASLLLLGGLLGLSYWRDTSTGHTGLTSEASALITFVLGALAASHDVIEPLTRRIWIVSSIAVAVTMLLSRKVELRELSTRVSRDDVVATLKFLLVAVVVFPVLPNEAHGPYGALNPFRIGLMVLLIASISFVGYVAMRLLGHGRGMLVTGAVGGLVSSTAVTLASADRAKKTPAIAGVSALATVIASTIMFPRILAIVLVVEKSLLTRLAPAMATMLLVGLAWSAAVYLRERSSASHQGEVELSNPFELKSAVQFGAFFVLILIASRWASATFGSSGSYATGVLAGLTDVDAITLSMANMVKAGTIDATVASRTIVLAAVSNTLVKGGMALVLGGLTFGKKVLLPFAVMLAAGLLVMLVT